MSKVLDAQPAAPSPAPVDTTPAVLPAGSVRERISSLSSEERSHYRATGELPEDKTPTADPSPAEDTTQAPGPSPEATKGPEPATGEDDPEPIVNESEKAKKSRLRNAARWDEVIEERGRLKAENEILRKQLAEKPAPTTSSVETPKAADASKKPRIADYPNTEEGVAKWEDDTEAYFDAKAEQRIAAAFSREKATTETAKVTETWNSQMTASKSAHMDFEKVADNAPISAVGLEIIKGHPQGTEILYFLGLPENAEEATRILGETDIDGLSYAALAKAQSNPAIKSRTWTALGVAKAEFNAIARTLKTKAPTEKTTAVSGKFPPSSTVQVPAKGTAIGDPIEEALSKRTPEGTRAYIRLMREKEIRELKGR